MYINFSIKQILVKMKKDNLSNYCKLATVLFLDVIPVWFLISLSSSKNMDDFVGLGFLIGFFFLLVFNVGAFIIYRLTKLIKRIWLRDIVFYLLLFSFFFIPFLALRLI